MNIFFFRKIAKLFPKDSKLVFGFDVEWPFTYKAGPSGGKVALIQMCPEERLCFLFHVIYFSFYFLKTIL